MALPKWTDERTAQLTSFIGDESPVSQASVAEAAEQLETSTRSVSSKLRKMGYEVELASAAGGKSFSAEQETTLAAFVEVPGPEVGSSLVQDRWVHPGLAADRA